MEADRVKVPGKSSTVAGPFAFAQLSASFMPFVEVRVPVPAFPGVAFEVEFDPKSAPELDIAPAETVTTGLPAAVIAPQFVVTFRNHSVLIVVMDG